MHTIGFNAMKALGMVQTHWIMQTRVTNAKTSISPRLTAFLSKNDVTCSKTRFSALKTRFMHIIGFNAMQALGMMKTHWIMQNYTN